MDLNKQQDFDDCKFILDLIDNFKYGNTYSINSFFNQMLFARLLKCMKLLAAEGFIIPKTSPEEGYEKIDANNKYLDFTDFDLTDLGHTVVDGGFKTLAALKMHLLSSLCAR